MTWMLITLIASVTMAQHSGTGNGKINGLIKDSVSGAPLEYATITLLEKTSGKVITGNTSNSAGRFTLSGIVSGHYRLVIEYMGYRSYVMEDVFVNSNANITIPVVHLYQSSKALAAVTVTGQTKLIDNRTDKMIYNAEKDLTSQGGVAADILRKVPQVSVDVDGNVQLAGNGSIRFLINGRPSTAFGSSIADVLQSIPASQIKSIEVITNPGARYDAQGLGGIINIILKQSTTRGVNGSVSLTTGTRVENGSFNFAARSGNFGINTFISGNTRLAVTTPSSSSRHSSDSTGSSLLNQDGSGRFKRHGIESGIGFDWTLQKKNVITGSFNYNQFGNNNLSNLHQQQTLRDLTGATIFEQQIVSNSGNSYKFHNIDASLDYKRTFAKEDQELEISVNSSFGHSRTLAHNEQFMLPNDSLLYGVSNINPGKENETQIAIDYTQPFTQKVLLGTGGKITFLDINSDAAVQSLHTGLKEYQYDGALSNNLNYHQKVYALYAELSFPVAHLFDVKMGSRYERTETTSFYSNAPGQAAAPGYNTLVPSIYFSRKIGDKQLLKLSYSKRIERPDYGDLNPFINTSDPKNITAGNPYLKPEIGQRVELGYSVDIANIGSLMATAFYRHNGQDIQPFVKYYTDLQVGDSIYHNVSVSSRENIGTEKNTGLNLFADLHLSSKLGFRTNVFMFHRHIINEIDKGNDRSSFNYRINMNATYQILKDLAGEFFGNFNSARNEVQGKYPSFTTYNIAVRKQFWNKKGSLAFVAVNPFNEYVNQRLVLDGPNFTQTSLRKIPFRSFGLNFTWKFGLLEVKKERETDNSDLNMAP